MYLCVCKSVSTKEVEAAVKTCGPCVDRVSSSCGAGTDCGACRPKLQKLVEEAAKTQSSPVKAAK